MKSHKLDALAWQPIDRGQPATLEYFMRDYVGHLEHHLPQGVPEVASAHLRGVRGSR